MSFPFSVVFAPLMLRFLACSLFAIFLLSSAHAADWELAVDSHDVRVWTRAVPDYPIREIRAETTVKSTLNGLVALLMDTENAARWIYRTDRIDLLKRDDASGSFLIHVMTDFPWPLTDRDAVVEGRIVQAADTGMISVSSRSLPASSYPASTDFVRMPDMEGSWTFQPLADGQVKVVMTMRANPGGNIPAAVVNLIIHETPYRTLRGLRKVIAEPRYQNAKLPQIREP
ncbi:MAG: START domain-containing protein [Pedobacter sp.]|nr:START domain-containing protein [Pedobacter sp.]